LRVAFVSEASFINFEEKMITFRHATQDDLELTYQIKELSIKPYVEKIWGWDEEDQLAFHQKGFKPEGIRILQNEQSEPIGLLDLIEDNACVYIKSLLICDFAQGKGIGTTILSEIIGKARLTNRRVELQVFVVNERARKLYESLGFKTIGQTNLHYQMRLD
jgi:RimJ/RimL family protein N-acetyltransferase